MAQAVSRIEREFIMKEFRENSLSFELHHLQKQYAATFTAFDEHRLTVAVSSPTEELPGEDESVDVFLRFRGQVMTFRTKVIEQDESGLILRSPRTMYRDLARAFRRIIAPSGISIEFQLNEKVITLNYPDSERHELPEKPQLNLGFDASKIAQLLAAFRTQAAEFSSENKVIMLRSRQPETLPERLICDTGRTLVVPAPKNLPSLVGDTIRERMLLNDDITRLESENVQRYGTLREELQEYTAHMNGKSVAYELFCPVLFHQYVVGYLYLLQGKSGKPLTSDVLEYVNQFARVLSYSLHQNGYFEIREELPSYQESELVDLSAQGALFTQLGSGLPISLYSQLQLKIHTENKTFETKARVMRKFKDRDRVYLGVRFTSMVEADFQELHKRLYGGPFEGKDESFSGEDSDRKQGY